MGAFFFFATLLFSVSAVNSKKVQFQHCASQEEHGEVTSVDVTLTRHQRDGRRQFHPARSCHKGEDFGVRNQMGDALSVAITKPERLSRIWNDLSSKEWCPCEACIHSRGQ